MSVIECNDIRKNYRSGEIEVQALRGVSLSIRKGEFVALTGPSGCGKTTLLNIIGGLDRPTSGEISVDGRTLNDLSNSDLADLRLRRVGFVFQAYNLVPVLSGLENVEFVLQLQGIDKSERRQRATNILASVGLAESNSIPFAGRRADQDGWRAEPSHKTPMRHHLSAQVFPD